MSPDKKIISRLYRQFSKRPATLDERNLRLLADFIVDERGITIEDDSLIFTCADAMSPFRCIMLEHIHGVADLGKLIAIVMHSSIIFFHKDTLNISVHLRLLSPLQKLITRLRL